MSLNILSWNVKGLGSPIKRQHVLSHIANLKGDIVLLQEIHISDVEILKLRHQWVGQVFASPGSGKRNGVAILRHKRLDVQLLSHKHDSDGRWVAVSLLTSFPSPFLMYTLPPP